jgi:hypothetical protein
VGHAGVTVRAVPRNDPRVRRIAIYAHAGSGRFQIGDPATRLLCTRRSGTCRDRRRRVPVRYAAVALDRWGRSVPWYSAPLPARH